MDVTNRLKQLVEIGVKVHRGKAYERWYHETEGELIGVFPDGSREYARGDHDYRARSGNSFYQLMLGLLQKEGIDTQRLRIKSKIDVDIHTLQLPNGEVYQFLLPSRRYLTSSNAEPTPSKTS